jgi:hypothetical protein
VASTNLDALLEHQVGDRIRVTVSGPTGRRDVTLRPVSTAVAGGLLYRQWVASRRALVDRWSGGRLGYVHIADMSEESLSQLYLDLDAATRRRRGRRRRYPPMTAASSTAMHSTYSAVPIT